MPAQRNNAYDEPQFKRLWYSRMTAREIAKRIGVTPPAVLRAAQRRGLPGKHEINAKRYGDA